MAKIVSQLASSAISTRKQCYANLFQLLKSDKKDEIYELCDSLPKLIPALLLDIKAAASDELSQAALRACGTLLHNSSVASALVASQIRDIIRTLCETIQNTTQKNDCILATWSLAVMSLVPGAAAVDVSVVLPALLYALSSSTFNSPSLEQEALGAMAKLLILRPDEMAAQMLSWAPIVYVRLFSHTTRVRDKAESILAAHTSLLCSATSPLSKKVYEDLRGGLLAQMNESLAESGKETIVMRAWGWFALLAGPMLWHRTLVNQMLKVPEKAFASTRPEVRLEAHVAWRRFVLNFRSQLAATPPSSQTMAQTSKRLALQLVPIEICFKSEQEEQVRHACLQTWLQLIAAVTLLPPTAQAELSSSLLESPLECLLKDTPLQPSSALRTAATEVLQVVAGVDVASGSTDNNDADDTAPSRPDTIQVRELRRLSPLPQASVLRLLRIALEQPHPVYDRLESVWRRLLASYGPGAQQPHDPTPLVPIVKFAASMAEVSDVSDSRKDWLGKAMYLPLLDRLQSLKLIHVSPSPPLADDRTLIGHLMYSWISTPAIERSTRAVQIAHLEPILLAGHGIDALSFTFTVIKEYNNLIQTHPPGFMLGACNALARVLQRILEVSLRIGGNSNEKDLATIFQVLRLPLSLALRPELEPFDAPAIADAETTWVELFGTLHRHALLGSTERASSVIEELSSKLPPLPLPISTAGVPVVGSISAAGVLPTPSLPLWCNLAVQVTRHILESFQWTKSHRSLSPRKSGNSGHHHHSSNNNNNNNSPHHRSDNILRIAGEATELAVVTLLTAPADSSRLLNLVAPIVQSLPSSFFSSFSVHFLPHYQRAILPLLSSPLFAVINSSFCSVWEGVLDALRHAPSSSYDSALLNSFAPIFREGFTSPERSIRSPTIEAWNATFGRVASRDIAIPTELITLLQSLRRKANILLPKHLMPNDAPYGDELLPPTPDEEMFDAIDTHQQQQQQQQRKDLDKTRRDDHHQVGASKDEKRPRRTEKSLPTTATLPPPPAAAATTTTTTNKKTSQTAYVQVAAPTTDKALPQTEKQKEAIKRKAGVSLYSKLDPSSLDGATQEAAELDPRKASAQITPAQHASAADTPQQHVRAHSQQEGENIALQLSKIVDQLSTSSTKLENESPESLHNILKHSLAIASKVAPLLKPRLNVVSQFY